MGHPHRMIWYGRCQNDGSSLPRSYAAASRQHAHRNRVPASESGASRDAVTSSWVVHVAGATRNPGVSSVTWPLVFDQATCSRNHNYMSTSQVDSTPADDVSGTGNDTNAGRQHAGEGKAGEGKAGEGTAGESEASGADKVRAWFAGRLPGEWFTAAPDIQADREEITIV